MSEKDDLVFTHVEEYVCKVLVIGDPAVGKTSLLNRFSSKQFKEQYLPTVGVNILKEKVDIDSAGDKIQMNLMLWDVAGQPQFYMLHRPYFNGADAMMLVFDITRSSTFSNVNNWYNTAVKYGLSGVPRILVGNKNDIKEERKITIAHAQHLSEKLNAPYFETSAKTGDNVKNIFLKIAEAVYHGKTGKNANM